MWTSNVVPVEIVWRPPKDPPFGVFFGGGGSPDFLAKSIVIPAMYTKCTLIAHKFNLEFRIYGWNYQSFSQKILGGSPDNSAGTTLMVHTVHTFLKVETLNFQIWQFFTLLIE